MKSFPGHSVRFAQPDDAECTAMKGGSGSRSSQCRTDSETNETETRADQSTSRLKRRRRRRWGEKGRRRRADDGAAPRNSFGATCFDFSSILFLSFSPLLPHPLLTCAAQHNTTTKVLSFCRRREKTTQRNALAIRPEKKSKKKWKTTRLLLLPSNAHTLAPDGRQAGGGGRGRWSIRQSISSVGFKAEPKTPPSLHPPLCWAVFVSYIRRLRRRPGPTTFFCFRRGRVFIYSRGSTFPSFSLDTSDSPPSLPTACLLSLSPVYTDVSLESS